jgi:hypothetical protein
VVVAYEHVDGGNWMGLKEVTTTGFERERTRKCRRTGEARTPLETRV